MSCATRRGNVSPRNLRGTYQRTSLLRDIPQYPRVKLWKLQKSHRIYAEYAFTPGHRSENSYT